MHISFNTSEVVARGFPIVPLLAGNAILLTDEVGLNKSSSSQIPVHGEASERMAYHQPKQSLINHSMYGNVWIGSYSRRPIV
jgi:hypothetical protein